MQTPVTNPALENPNTTVDFSKQQCWQVLQYIAFPLMASRCLPPKNNSITVKNWPGKPQIVSSNTCNNNLCTNQHYYDIFSQKAHSFLLQPLSRLKNKNKITTLEVSATIFNVCLCGHLRPGEGPVCVNKVPQTITAHHGIITIAQMWLFYF